jgi:hypothetical protein
VPLLSVNAELEERKDRWEGKEGLEEKGRFGPPILDIDRRP